MSDKMKDETIALVAIDMTIRQVGQGLRNDLNYKGKTIGQIAEEALEHVEKACSKGQLGILYGSFTEDPDEIRSLDDQ